MRRKLSSQVQFPLFQQFGELDHWISTRHSEATQPPAHRVQQIHSNKVHWLESDQTLQPLELRPQADALLTDQPGQLLRIGVSDCVPILLFNPKRRILGVVHAGFKGTMQDILTVVLQEVGVKHTYVGIGPAIGASCYHDIDLQMENVIQARQAGVSLSRIDVLRLCTKCNVDTFFSHRAGDDTNFGLYAQLR